MNAPVGNLLDDDGTGPASDHAAILARNIMSSNVVMVGLDTDIHEIARLLSERQLGAVSVVHHDKFVGIITEVDLLRREELGTEPSHCAVEPADPECLKSHGRCARDVMRSSVITVTEDTPLQEIAEVMECKRISNVPVVREGRMVGLVSRTGIVRALAARPDGSHGPLVCDDDIVRFKVIETLMGIPGASAWLTDVSVTNGVVRLSGTVQDENVREPSRRIVEGIPCVKAVDDHRSIMQPY
jgi:CBS domain-containing protein